MNTMYHDLETTPKEKTQRKSGETVERQPRRLLELGRVLSGIDSAI